MLLYHTRSCLPACYIKISGQILALRITSSRQSYFLKAQIFRRGLSSNLSEFMDSSPDSRWPIFYFRTTFEGPMKNFGTLAPCWRLGATSLAKSLERFSAPPYLQYMLHSPPTEFYRGLHNLTTNKDWTNTVARVSGWFSSLCTPSRTFTALGNPTKSWNPKQLPFNCLQGYLQELLLLKRH